MKKIIAVRQQPISLLLQTSNLPKVVQQVYANRGITKPEEADKTLSSLLPYHTLRGMDQAVLCLFEALQHQKRILIVGDYDVDGAVSVVLMMRVLRELGAKQVDFLVPNRFKQGYGLTPELLKLALEQKPDLIITVDNGIASVEAVAMANEHQVQVLITDHHVTRDELPKATAIVNPNQPDDLFPSKNLAGVGVAFYVLLALRAYLRERHWFIENKMAEPNLADYLDLVALGTVADIVMFDQNNRILIHQGLQRIRKGKSCFGIQALLSLAGRLPAKATVRDLGFVVGPRLNASGRLDDMTLGIRCLLTDDFAEAEKLALQLEKLNRERRAIEDTMKQEAFSVLEELNACQNLPMGICLMNEKWHEGIIGILASRIKDQLHRPVIVLTRRENSEIKGSARSVPGLHMHDLLTSIDKNYPGMITRFGGHAMAAGLSLSPEAYPKFSEIFDQAIRDKIQTIDLQEKIFSDGELLKEDFSIDLTQTLLEAGPWGSGFEEPLFCGKFRIVNQYIVGGKHLKLTLEYADQLLDGIVFYVDRNTWPNNHCQFIHAVYRLDINDYQGQKKLQLVVKYLEPIDTLE